MSRLFKIGLIVFASGLLVACTSKGGGRYKVDTIQPAVLKPYNFWTYAGGYKDEVLAPNRFKVEVAASGSTTYERAVAILMTRAAEMAQASGNTVFVIDRIQLSMRCFYSAPAHLREMGSAAGLPTAKIEVTAQPDNTFPDDALVFSVRKVLDVLHPVVATVEDKPGLERAIISQNDAICRMSESQRLAAIGPMPWNNHDIVEKAGATAPSPELVIGS
ncbi:hypothetical protein [Pyruvatibacter sp.]|uniref:hypothetical protein n=1 Tax=Pyruvatibacter sp. TaxID=1981328 RepID=UPI00326515DE